MSDSEINSIRENVTPTEYAVNKTLEGKNG